MGKSDRQAGAEIEITPEMIEAGLDYLIDSGCIASRGNVKGLVAAVFESARYAVQFPTKSESLDQHMENNAQHQMDCILSALKTYGLKPDPVCENIGDYIHHLAAKMRRVGKIEKSNAI